MADNNNNNNVVNITIVVHGDFVIGNNNALTINVNPGRGRGAPPPPRPPPVPPAGRGRGRGRGRGAVPPDVPAPGQRDPEVVNNERGIVVLGDAHDLVLRGRVINAYHGEGKKLGNKYMSIDPSTVSIVGGGGSDNGFIKLPGCFTAQFNLEVLQSADLSQSFLSKVEFNWASLPEFANLPCQNQSADGCNGYGNNCYYCDICNSLKKVKDSSSNIVKQFGDINCPDKPGIYLLKKEFCFKDFKELDKNNNCKLDALEEKGGEEYKKALDNLQLSGYGTVVAKFTLATNATASQDGDQKAKQQEIAANTDDELKQRRMGSGWAVNDAEFAQVEQKFIKDRQNLWHKTQFLPRLISENEIACLSVSFTVCHKKPVDSNGQMMCPGKTFFLF